MMNLQQLVPAAFNNTPSEEVSPKYQFISTEEIMGTFQENNWFPTKVSQVRSRKNPLVAKHLVRFRNPDINLSVNGLFPEIVMINSHNRTTSFKLLAGLFRMVCENGMIIADSTFQTVKTRHSSLAPEIIASGIEEIVEIVPKISEKTEQMIELKMNKVDQLQLASNVVEAVWTNPKIRPLEPTQLLELRRNEDKEPNLWNTYNTIQENIIKGGLIGKTTTNRSRKQRAITNIDKDVKINQILWEQSNNFLVAA